MNVRRVPLFCLFLFVPVHAGETLDTVPFLKGLPGLTVTASDREEGFAARFQLTISQPLDHQHPEAGTFEQRVFLSHRHFKAPMIIETKGYGVRGFPTHELSRLLEANQLVVEYRYYGESRPEKAPWRHLTNRQGAADHHRIIEMFKQFYPGPWLSAGYSKGGESALIHRTLYPDDVAATVCYDTPLILAREDPRTEQFLREVGTDETRANILEFQRMVLQKQVEIVPLLRQKAQERQTGFQRLGPLAALEYAVLEYPFSFWQRGGKPAQIPGRESSPEQLLAHLLDITGYWVYSDAGIQAMEPSFYQHMRELGYYGFSTEGLEDVLVAVQKPDNVVFAPQDVDLSYDPSLIRSVHGWAEHDGDRVLYLYGETDTWRACAVSPKQGVDARVFVIKGGYHNSHLTSLPDQEKALARADLQRWMGCDIKPF